MKGLIEGRIVHFVLDNGEHRPAIIVRLFESLKEQGTVNMIVFLDGSNDTTRAVNRGQTPPDTSLMVWRTSVHYSEAHEPRTWHWTEPA